jgi:hypothetical protein
LKHTASLVSALANETAKLFSQAGPIDPSRRYLVRF